MGCPGLGGRLGFKERADTEGGWLFLLSVRIRVVSGGAEALLVSLVIFAKIVGCLLLLYHNAAYLRAGLGLPWVRGGGMKENEAPG